MTGKMSSKAKKIISESRRIEKDLRVKQERFRGMK